MLSSKRRLPPKAYEQRRKKIFSDPSFDVHVSRNEIGYNRYGVVVSKKIDKRATRRNFIKRRVLCVLQKKEDVGMDVVVYVKRGLVIRNKTKESLRGAIKELGAELSMST